MIGIVCRIIEMYAFSKFIHIDLYGLGVYLIAYFTENIINLNSRFMAKVVDLPKSTYKI